MSPAYKGCKRGLLLAAIHAARVLPLESIEVPPMKNWLITGVSRGLGKALAEAALARGDTVIGTVREGDPLIAKGAGVFHRLSLDMRDPKAIEAAASRTFELVNRLDVVVNNAGHGLLGPIESVSDADMTSLFETNVFGPVRLIRAVLPRLRAQRSGHIINVTSIAGRAPNPGSGVYAATKSASGGTVKSVVTGVGASGHQGDRHRAGRIPDRFPQRSFDPPDAGGVGRLRCLRRQSPRGSG